VRDTIEIQELLARYARGVDSKDWELYRSVFTRDAFIDYSSAGGSAGPRDEVAAWLEQAFETIAIS
jgi:SnoaL-like domain